ncbi:protein FAM170A-like [Eptesicus fuscus]|uniref:protein FAM170A-like n=1 Tax=Eptesicus fuscus TaxID=29078 RepID=UPI002403ED26|nr:protein FAM170A-like [Eptesicus fuscus]
MKHKEKKKHLERPCRTQEDVPKPQSFMEGPGCSQAAAENSSTSEYFTCVSSLSSLSHHVEDGTCSIQQDAPQPQSFMEAPGCIQAAGENASASEYFTCVSSPSKRPRYDEDGSHQLQQNFPYLGNLNISVSESTWKRKIMEWTIGGFHQLKKYFSYFGKLNMPVYQPARKRKIMEGHIGGFHQLQQNFPYLGNLNMPVYQPARKWKIMDGYKGGIKERRVPKNLVQKESSSDYSYSSNSSHSTSNKEPGLMKIYYMRVQMKRGVAVLCHTGEGWEPPSKKIKMEEMTYTTEVHKNVPLSHMSGENLLNDPEPSVDSPAQEKREKAGCNAEPPNLVAYRRIPLRRALESGFRCLACCRVFASLEALQGHVEHGVQEGFSCHVFHRAMARLKYKKLKRKQKKLMKATLSCQEEKHLTRRQT